MSKVIWLFPHALQTFHYLRESEVVIDEPKQYSRERFILPGVPGAAVIAYETDGKKTSRFWWVMSHFDGIEECPLNRESLPDYWLVDPKSIQPNEESQPWRALAVPGLIPPPLQSLPPQIAYRFERHRQQQPRIQLPRSRFARRMSDLRTKFRSKRRQFFAAVKTFYRSE